MYILSDGIIDITEDQFKDILETTLSGVVELDVRWNVLKNVFLDKNKAEILESVYLLRDVLWDRFRDSIIKCVINEIRGIFEENSLYKYDDGLGYRYNIRTVLKCFKQKNCSTEEFEALKYRLNTVKRLKQADYSKVNDMKDVIKSFNKTFKKIKCLKHYKRIDAYRHKYIHRHSLPIDDVLIRDIRIVAHSVCKLMSDIYFVINDIGNSCKIYNGKDIGRVTLMYLDKGIEFAELSRKLEFDELNEEQEKDVVERILNLNIHNHKYYNIKSIDMGYIYRR